jgi:hypothetical protein
MSYIILYNLFKIFNNMKRQREELGVLSTNKKHKTAYEITDTGKIEEPFVELIITKENFEDTLAKIKDKDFPVHNIKLEGISNPEQRELLIKAIGSKPTMTSLDLSSIHIGNKEAAVLAEMLKENTTLDTVNKGIDK